MTCARLGVKANNCNISLPLLDRAESKMRLFSSLILQALLVGSFACAAQAQSVERGAALARANCARCHSIERSGLSPFLEAPPFRMLHRKYPVEMLEEALVEGIFTGHPAMPEFELKPGQIGDFISFLKSLE